MAKSDAYATAAEYRARLSKTDTSEDAEILLDLTAVSRYLERLPSIGRDFNLDAAVTTRLYWPERQTKKIWVEDIGLSAGFEVKVDEDQDGSFADETAWASTDYQLWPLNADKGPEAKAWTAIVVPPWSSKGAFYGAPVQVTARHGWPAVPEAIKAATVHLTGILRLESPRATERVPEGVEGAFATSKRARSIVADLVRSYGRPSMF